MRSSASFPALLLLATLLLLSVRAADAPSTPSPSPPPPPPPARDTIARRASDFAWDEPALICDAGRLAWEIVSRCETEPLHPEASVSCCEAVITAVTTPRCFCDVVESESILEDPYFDDESVYYMYTTCGGSSPAPLCDRTTTVPPAAPSSPPRAPVFTPPPPVFPPPAVLPPTVIVLSAPVAPAGMQAPPVGQDSSLKRGLGEIGEKVILAILGAFGAAFAIWFGNRIRKFFSVPQESRTVPVNQGSGSTDDAPSIGGSRRASPVADEDQLCEGKEMATRGSRSVSASASVQLQDTRRGHRRADAGCHFIH